MRTRTRSFIVFTVFLASWLALALAGGQGQKPPTFKGGIDLLQLDVTVLDKSGKPVRGLKAGDFTLFEDGKPQTIESFAEIDVPETVHSGPAWSRDVTPDVTSNQIDNRRIFVIVLDDARGVGGPLGRKEMIRTGEAIIDALGPQDMAAIVFTMQVKKSQNLTNDRNKLLTALHAYPISGFNMPTTIKPPPSPGRSASDPRAGVGCLSIKETLSTMRSIVEHLATVPDRRKAVLYYGGMMPWVITPGDDPCGTYWLWREILTSAQRGHVSINPIRPTGGIKANEDYMAVAENTGGHSVTVGDVMQGVKQILVENSSYYLLAYQMKPGDPDGTYRRLTVKVNRQDVEVVTRRGYWTPRVKTATGPAETPSPDIEALAGILPSSKLNLHATVAAFPVAGTNRSAIAITIGVTQPAFTSRTSEVLDVLVKAYSADGDPKGSETAMIPIAVPAARRGADESRYEVLARVEVPKPGKYEVRLTAHSAETDRRGSVYLDVDVPDFLKGKLAMSGVVLTNRLSLIPVAPPRLLADLAPGAPTAERVFTNTDRVSAFLRIAQGGRGKLADVPFVTRVLDGFGTAVITQAETMAADRFSADRTAEVRFQVPLDRLSPGEHLLTFEATLDKIAARRDVVFTVK